MNENDEKPESAEIDRTIPMDVDRTIPMDVDRTIRLPDDSATAPLGEGFSAGKRPTAVVVFEKTGNLTRTMFGQKHSVHETIVEHRFNDETDDGIDSVEPALAGASLPDINNGYVLLRTVAKGGQGQVVLYEDKTLGRKIAVKSLLGSQEKNRECRGRFVVEAKVTSRLEHPSIPPVHGLFGDSGDRLYMAMKMIKGMTLSEYLEQVRVNYSREGVVKYDVKKDLFERLNIFLRVCYAMEYAHEHHVAHCDLKPDNIMIGRYNETYVMDWGIALTKEQLQEKRAVSGRKVAGTPRFLSPETISGDESWKDDEKVRKYGWMSDDIYALGLILFEIATLGPAYDGKTTDDILRRITRREMAPIVNRFGCRIGKDLAAIIEKATAADMRNRYHSVHSLEEDVSKYMRGDEVSARPDNLPGKVIRWGTHHTQILLIAVLAGLLLTSCVTSFWIYSRLAEQRLEQRITIAAAKALKTGDELDHRFDKLDAALWMLGLEAKMLLTAPENVPFSPSGALPIGSGPGVSPLQVSLLDPEHIYYLRAPGLSVAEAEASLSRLKMLEAGFMRIVLESNDLGTAENLGEFKKDLVKSRLLVSRIFFGLRNGLHVVYPRNLSYPAGYDPRLRDWYRDPATPVPAGSPYWLCYQDVSSGRWVLSGRIVVSGAAPGVKLGVMAFDIPVQNIYRLIRRKTTDGRKLGVLLNEKGRIMPADGGPPGPRHPAFTEIQKLEFGRYRAKDGAVYLFTRLKAPKWFYVEKFSQ